MANKVTKWKDIELSDKAKKALAKLNEGEVMIVVEKRANTNVELGKLLQMNKLRTSLVSKLKRVNLIKRFCKLLNHWTMEKCSGFKFVS